MGLVTPNRNDDMVRTNAKKVLDTPVGLAMSDGVRGTETFEGYYEKYIESLMLLFGERYVMNKKYFYTVAPESTKGSGVSWLAFTSSLLSRMVALTLRVTRLSAQRGSSVSSHIGNVLF